MAITNLGQSRDAEPRHSSGKRLFELADVAIDTCVPIGDALLSLPGLDSRTGASSTVARAAIIHSVIVEALGELLRRNGRAIVLPSANVEGTTEESLVQLLNPWRGRIKYLRMGASRED